ncbi:hypothetical protein JCM19235_3854 [Vibrio maritimus]|uniref:Uncharacterized protein n=1 Tax=Vibrio maritimus TaxID=990268 RepID=A0A090SN92_9VIBR|nr:hypothetical protein JCM19235_3854 [Vibrio maritimus]
MKGGWADVKTASNTASRDRPMKVLLNVDADTLIEVSTF